MKKRNKNESAISFFLIALGEISFFIGLSTLIVFASIVPENIIGETILLKTYPFFTLFNFIIIFLLFSILYGGYILIKKYKK